MTYVQTIFYSSRIGNAKTIMLLLTASLIPSRRNSLGMASSQALPSIQFFVSMWGEPGNQMSLHNIDNVRFSLSSTGLLWY